MKKYQFITISFLLYMNMNYAWFYAYRTRFTILAMVLVLLGLLVKEKK